MVLRRGNEREITILRQNDNVADGDVGYEGSTTGDGDRSDVVVVVVVLSLSLSPSAAINKFQALDAAFV